jgi:hypothetical protein
MAASVIGAGAEQAYPHRVSTTSNRKTALCRRRGVSLAAGCLAASAVLLAGCSGHHGKNSGASASAGAPKGQTVAIQLLSRTRISAAKATSVRIRGSMPFAGKRAQVDLLVRSTDGVFGTIAIGSGSASFRVTQGNLYVKGNAAFWNALEPGTGPAFADRWVQASPQTGAEFATLIQLGAIPTALNTLVPPDGTPTASDGKTVAGQRTIAIKRAGTPQTPGTPASESETLYVAKNDPGYPVLIEYPGGASLTFSRWGGPAPVVTPPPGPVLDVMRTPLHG